MGLDHADGGPPAGCATLVWAIARDMIAYESRVPAKVRWARRDPKTVVAVLMVTVVLPALGGAGGPTEIVRVDDFIGAPRALFGRTGPEIERTLGPPRAVERGAVESYRDPTVFHPVRRLDYPDLVIDVLDSGAVRRVRVQRAGLGLPLGLEVGTPRGDVERVLGEPQQAGDSHLMYLYSDGYPDTVHFHFRAGRVWRIEWNFGSAE